MIAARAVLDHRRLARRIERGEEDGGLDLRRRHRQLVSDRNRIRGTDQRQRQACAAPRQHLGAHARDRLGDTRHRPAAQRGIAGEKAGEWMRRQQPDQEPGRGARVAEVENTVGLGEPADANAGDPPCSVVVTAAGDAKRIERGGGRHHVLALEQAGDRGLADRHGGDHQRAVRDRFVAGNPYRARDPIGRPGRERVHPGPFVCGCRPNRGVTSVTRTARAGIACNGPGDFGPTILVLTG